LRDIRFWWALFVIFGVLSVLALQRGYAKWRRARSVLAALHIQARAEHARRLRREGWRLACMAASLVAMTALVFAALSGAPPVLVLTLRAAALLLVTAVVGLSLFR
jgi:fatty acid desaturase